MKTTTLLAITGGLVYLGYRAKQAAEEAAAAATANLRLPPPPANSGPVVNGLSFYQLEGLHGIGSKIKKGIKKVTKSKVAKIVTKIDPVAATVHQVKKTVDDPSRLKKLSPLNMVSKLPGANKLPLVNRVSRSGTPKKETPEAGQQVVFQDVNGAIITEAQYNAIVQARSTGTPVAIGDKWALPEGYITSVDPFRKSPEETSTAYTNNRARPVYRPSGRPSEDLVVTNSYSDDWGQGPATAFSAPSAGAPGLPGGITTELTTPAAEEALPDMPAPAESNTGKLLVGTALAAGAAYLAFG